MIDDLAGGGLVDAQVIEVRAEQDGLLGERGIGAAEQADGVVGGGAGREWDELELGGFESEGLELGDDVGGGDEFVVSGAAALRGERRRRGTTFRRQRGRRCRVGTGRRAGRWRTGRGRGRGAWLIVRGRRGLLEETRSKAGSTTPHLLNTTRTIADTGRGSRRAGIRTPEKEEAGEARPSRESRSESGGAGCSPGSRPGRRVGRGTSTRPGRCRRHRPEAARRARKGFAWMIICSSAESRTSRSSKSQRDALQDVAIAVEHLEGGFVGVVDKAADLGIDLASGFLGVIAVLGDFAAEEDLLLLLAEGERTELAHAPLADHLAGNFGGALDIVAGAGGHRG